MNARAIIGFLRQRPLATAAALAALAGAFLYWPVLTLPIIYDDLLHIRIARGLNLATVWLPTDQFGFYRPLTFLPFLLIEDIFGRYPGWLLHGLNVFQHSLNAVLLTGLSWRLWRDLPRTLVAGLLYAVFPFSYQAFAISSVNAHLTTAGLLLAGLHAYLSALKRRSSRSAQADGESIGRPAATWWAVTGGLFLLALLSHESAVLFGPLAALVHWSAVGSAARNDLRRPAIIAHRLPPWVIFTLLGVIYAVIYQFLPISRAPEALGEGAGGLWLRLLYLFQSASYPLSWFAHRLPNVGATELVLFSLAATLFLTVWTARHPGRRLPLLLGWGWWGVSSLLIALSLPTDYLLHGPRLLYLGSVGLSIAWAQLLSTADAAAREKPLLILAVAFVLITNWLFVRGRLRDYARLTSPVTTIADQMIGRPADEGIVIVNLPQWLAPSRNTYAVGAETVAMLGNYLFADELIVANVPGNHEVYPVAVPDLLGRTSYPYGIHDEVVFRGNAAATLPIPSDWTDHNSQVFVVRYEETGLQTIHAGGFQRAMANRPAIATLGPYRLLQAANEQCGGRVQTELTWMLNGADPILPTLSIFVQLLDENGHLISQADGPPLGLRPDLVKVAEGWQVRDKRIVEVGGSLSPTAMLVGVYDYLSGQRLQALDAQGSSIPGDALNLPIAPCPPGEDRQ